MTRSWAGQMESFLNVTTRASLGRAVLACWRSLHGERAKAYRSLASSGHEGPAGDDAMAVVVQEMLEPRASGVLFTMDPVGGRRDRMVVSAVLGIRGVDTVLVHAP